MLSRVEHEKKFITSGPGLNSMSLHTFTVTETLLKKFNHNTIIPADKTDIYTKSRSYWDASLRRHLNCYAHAHLVRLLVDLQNTSLIFTEGEIYRENMWYANTRKWPVWNLRTTQALISLRTRAGWSELVLFANRINEYCSICRRTENVQIRLHGCARSSGPTLFAYGIRALSQVAHHVMF